MSFLFPSPTITFEAALRDLGSRRAKARAAAAHALGEVGSEAADRRRAVEALIAALDDDAPEVRMEACASLGELGEPAAVPHLIARLDDGAPAVRQNAAIALGAIGDAAAFAPLADALRDGPVDLRFQAATSLAEIDPERAFEPVLAALDDPDPQVIAAAALSVGAIAREHVALRPRAAAVLAPRLDHHDAATRFDVAYALAELGDGAGREVLATALADAERAWDAVSALAELSARDELARALADRRTPPEARVLAAGKLLTIDAEHAAARAVLLDGLASRKDHVRGLAVEQLAEVGGPWAAPALDKLARSGKASDLRDAITAALRKARGEPGR